MPKDKDFKRLVRTRAATTGESYTTARAHLTRRRAVHEKPVTVAVSGAAGRVAYNLYARVVKRPRVVPEARTRAGDRP